MSKSTRIFVVTPRLLMFLRTCKNGLKCSSCPEPIGLGDTVVSTMSTNCHTKRRHEKCTKRLNIV